MDWKSISSRILDGGMATPEEALALLEAPNRELLDILQAAYQLRHTYFGNTVSLHLLRNVKSGVCPEDCSFCSQSTQAINDVERYESSLILMLTRALKHSRHFSKIKMFGFGTKPLKPIADGHLSTHLTCSSNWLNEEKLTGNDVSHPSLNPFKMFH